MEINKDHRVICANNLLVDFSIKLVRGLSSSEIEDYVAKILAVRMDVSIIPILDLCVLAFHTRNIRGGKGERKLSYEILAAISKNYRNLVLDLLKHLPEYGCWRDVFTVGKQLEMTDEVIEMVAKQLKEDMMLLVIPDENSKISMLAKWAPREKTHDSGLVKKLSFRLFPSEKTYQGKMASYRKMLSSLNRHIDTVEIKMCSEKFASIVPSKVPGHALQNYRKAFLNRTKGRTVRSKKPDRVECAEHFLKYFEKSTKYEITMKETDIEFPIRTPFQILRSQLDDEMYDPVRETVGKWINNNIENEGPQMSYWS